MNTAAGRAVLFDIDGTLVDTNYLHVLAWRRVFLEHDEPRITAAQIHRLVGMGSDELLDTLFGRPRPELKPERARHFDALKDEIRAFPGAADLLRAVHDRGARVVLATSAEKSDLEEAGTAPEATVVVGDTVWDVQAASRAGLRCVGVTSGGISRAELLDAGAVAVYDDVAALLDQLDDSPLLGAA